MARPRNASTAARRRSRQRSRLRFNRKLVVNQWLLSLFGVTSFAELRQHLCDESLEGLDENNVHRFHHAICLHIPAEQRPDLPDDLLLAYDQEIVAVTQRLNEARITWHEDPITWKYFQYLALLFTEIYLDQYFRDPEGLRHAINEQIRVYNSQVEELDQITPFDPSGDARTQLNKLAFWMATGSGKTLVMHANILQYMRHLERHGRTNALNHIILLTPNEGLSQQHLREFTKSGIYSEIFQKAGTMFSGRAVEILEITKLRDEMGDTTVAVDAFEGNNLVLVDEGHRGTSAGQSGTWMRHRNALCERGFSFEYSATFGQAVNDDRELVDQYARSIAFDYSYRWFHGDGFGKDYHILNLEDDSDEEWMKTYLTGCLLTFYQQQRLYRDGEKELAPFNIERPLWVFVGSSVTATLANRDASDIVEILRFLEDYVSDRSGTIRRIARILNEGLVNAAGKNLFAGRFAYLNSLGLSPEQVFEETLRLTFNAPGGGRLYIENLAGAQGEVALRLGDNEPFGVINVGDDNKLIRICENEGFHTSRRQFSGSLFHELDEPDSTVHVLIGSKKFTEGWNSWRVSTMGLMNVGRGEGAQIIQLFGRGVRLKGYAMSLKRSSCARLPQDVVRPQYIADLETLSIFGIRADYMAQFRDFLDEEDIPVQEGDIEVVVPIVPSVSTRGLKTVRLQEEIGGVRTDFGRAFRDLGPIPTLQPPDPQRRPGTEWLQENPVELNWYPKIAAMRSRGLRGGDAEAKLNEGRLSWQHVALLDLDRIYFELERYKAERGWYNLNLIRSGIKALLHDHSWYKLYIPESELAFDSIEKVYQWHEIAVTLLKMYTKKYYTFYKRQWELAHLEYRELTADDPNFPVVKEEPPVYGFRVLVAKDDVESITRLKELKAMVESQRPGKWSFDGTTAIFFDKHLYQPLLAGDNTRISVTPIPLNSGERRFVEDLKRFCEMNPPILNGTELFLLRNLSKGHGIGFFEAGNFFPDFILWLVREDDQHVVFVDPKGMLHLGKDSQKVAFHETIKEVEYRLGEPNVKLHAFLVSNTSSAILAQRWGFSKEEMERRHVLFPREGDNKYIEQMIDTVFKGL